MKEHIKNISGRIGWVLFYLVSFCTILAFFAERWLFNTWADLSADEIVYHLKASLGGTNPEMVRDALLFYGLPALAVIILVFVLTRYLTRNKKLRPFVIGTVLCLDLSCLFFLKYNLDKQIGFTQYVMNQLKGTDSTFIADNYVDPGDVDLEFPEQKRNLVYIYLESMEMTFADKANGGAFEKNVIPELTNLAENNEDFSGSQNTLNGGISLPGSTWTIGAMFSHSTGLPLKIPLNGNKMKDRDVFFPGLKSLGTILKDEGYQQELLIGSKAKFGGRDIFYKSHGDFQLNDYSYAVEHGRIPKDYKVFWGYEDEKLFQFAREDLKKLSAGKEPFNLTMLTVDTHFEDGYRCRLCRNDFGEQYADAMACSSRQVTEFIQWIQDQDFYKDTTIVVCGDHPTMDKDFCQNVPSDYQRKTYICYINSPVKPEDEDAVRLYSTFDLFPSTLAAMGVTIPGNRLGLGANLFSNRETILEKYGLEKCTSELKLPSEFMTRMSGITVTEKTLKNLAEKTIILTRANDDGTMTLSLRNIQKFLSSETVRDLVLELKDKETGEMTIYHPELSYPNQNDPNIFFYDVDVDLKGKSLDDYQGDYYITIDGIDHYKIADFTHIY